MKRALCAAFVLALLVLVIEGLTDGYREAPRHVGARVAPVKRRLAPAAISAPRVAPETSSTVATPEKEPEAAPREEAPRTVESSLAILRGSDLEKVSELFSALIDAGEPLASDMEEALLAFARNRDVDPILRADALEVLGRVPTRDPAITGRLALYALERSFDDTVRFAAVTALHEVALANESLAPRTREALLGVASRVEGPLRAAAIEGIRLDGASGDELAATVELVSDPSPDVRGAAARAVQATDVSAQKQVSAGLEAAFFRETDPEAAEAELTAALHVARASASSLLERMAAAPIVSRRPELARRLADYRALLAQGETDPSRIVEAHESREDKLLVEQTAPTETD